MSGKKRKSSRRERIPVIDTLLDLAQAATMDYIFYKRREKQKGRRGGKIDSYAATGAAMGMGMIKDTEDLLKLGGVLGTMGAFDPDDELYIDTDTYSKPRDNRYAWRFNCEDGQQYGVNPSAYETREEYNAALKTAKGETQPEHGRTPSSETVADETKQHEEFPEPKKNEKGDSDSTPFHECTDEAVCREAEISRPHPRRHIPKETQEDDDLRVHIFCLVELSKSQKKKYYLTEDRTLKCSDEVLVPSGTYGTPVKGVICRIEHHMSFSAPQPVEDTQAIIGRV